MRREVFLNVLAEKELATLHEVDPVAVGAIEAVLDALEDDSEGQEHEPWPNERGVAFLTHGGATSWHIAWIYSRDGDQVLVGKIFGFNTGARPSSAQ